MEPKEPQNNEQTTREDSEALLSAEPKHSSNSRGKKLLAILVIVLLVGSAAATYVLLFKQKDNPTVIEQQAEKTQVQQPGSADLSELFKSISAKITQLAAFAKQSGDAANHYVIVKDAPTQQYVSVSSGTDYLYFTNKNNKAGVSEKKLSEVFSQNKQAAVLFESELIKAGFMLAPNSSSISDHSDSGSDDYGARYQNDTSICDIRYGVYGEELSCALDEEVESAQKTVAPFYKAYSTKTPNTHDLIVVNTTNIKKVGTNYERAEGTLGGVDEINGVISANDGGYAKFYRKAGEDWKIFATGQSLLQCTEYNTVVLQTVFAPEECIVSTDKTSTVEQYYSQ